MTLLGSTSAEDSLVAGTTLADRYRILEPLGRGAMGSVYRAADEHLGEEIALKLLHADLDAPEHQSRLRQEVRLARRVSHPNVCRVHDLGRAGERLFVTMELLAGRPLRALIDAGDLGRQPLGRRIDIVVQIAAGLAAAHRAGVIHRDIKPDNVILADEGGAGERAVLTDFGVASLARSASRSIAGTPAYMAPELLRGWAADPRIDTYSLAVLAYELVAGRRPFAVSSVSDALERSRTHAPPPPPTLPADCADAEVRRALEDVLTAALSVDRTLRPDPIDRLAELLARAAGGERPSPEVLATRAGESPERAATAVVARLPAGGPGADALERPITDLGGTLVAVSEGTIEALFGAPRSRGDDATRAAFAALAVAGACRGAAVAIHTGRARVTTGDAGKLEASGPALERARELAREPGVVCSPETRGQLAGRFAIGELVAGRYAVADRLDAAPRAAPLAGRRPELAALEEASRLAFGDRRARFIRITGPAGIGKSRLVEELLARLGEHREHDTIALRAAAFGDASPLALLRQAIPDGDRPEELRARILERAARRPVVLVADDLQWADPASVAFLADLERLLDDTPLLAIYVARIPPPALIGGDELALGPLAADEARALITGIAPAADEPAVTAAVDRAAGNPFLLEELGRALREGRPALPDSAVAAAQEQLDRLGELSREIAGQAAVLGHAFEPTAIAWLSARRDTVGVAVAAALDDLCEQRILVADAGEGERLHYRFASPLVREVAYNEIPTGERRRLHAAAAAYLADRAGTDPGELRALAEHWERGGRPERARDAYRAAGDAALSRFAFGEAADALVRAESLTPAAAREPDLLIQAGLALDHTDGPAAESRFRAAAARLPGDDRRRALVFLHLGRLAAARSDNEEAIAKLRAGLAAVADDDVTTRAQLYANLGGLLGYVMNDNETGLELSERAVALLEDTPHRRELAFALGRLGGNYMRAGRWRDQLECNRRNLEIGRELGDLNHQIIAHINLGEVNKSLGEIDEAIEHTEAALALCHRTGSANTRALGLSNLGILLVERGEMTNAEKRLSRGLELGARTGYDRFFYETYAGLSRIHYLRGDLPAAEEWARKSVKVAIASGSEVSEGISLRFLAAARGARGELVQGLFHLRRAHACLAPRDLYEDARTEVVEARLLTLRDEPGDRDRAEALRAGAAATFERLGARLDRARLADPEDLR